MRCDDYNRLLEFADGKLEPGAEADTRRHLQACAACRTMLSGFEPTPARDDHPVPLTPVVVGERVGRYVISGWLGAGGMGVVLRAHDPDLQRDVAVKLLGAAATTEGARDRLLREARLAARISHPNVVSVFDVGVEHGRVFVAMELIEGESLARWLVEPRRTGEILDVFVQAARGLSAAHEAGIVHGDFKPANLLVGRNGQVKVIDFGLSRAMVRDECCGAAASRHGVLVTQLAGTPSYMAPELWNGSQADARSDQFSFAVALWNSLGASGAPIGDALQRATNADPSARFESMAELIEAVRPRELPNRSRVGMTLGAAAAILAIALCASPCTETFRSNSAASTSNGRSSCGRS